MFHLLPEEILGGILEYADPKWAYALSRTNKELQTFIKKFYQQYATDFVRPDGIWYGSIKSKRTRTSLQNTQQIISYAPMGLHSILHQRCVGCHEKFMASVHKDFGIIAHPECIRGYLINLYYFEKFGLEEAHFRSVPCCQLAGYSNGSYHYTTVWKDKTKGIVPYEWTAHYLFHHHYLKDVRLFLKKKKQQEEEALARRQVEAEERKRIQKETEQRVRQLYRERMNHLMDLMAPTLTSKQFKTVLKTKLPEKYMSFYFKASLEWSLNDFSAQNHRDAKYLVSNVHRLMTDLTLDEISEISFQDLGKPVEFFCREKVKCVMVRLMETVHRRCSPPPPPPKPPQPPVFLKKTKNRKYQPPSTPTPRCACGKPLIKFCVYHQCAVCCQGWCSAHPTK